MLVNACKSSLVIYEGALNDQEEMKGPDLGKALGYAFNLESLDLGGCTYVFDDFF